MGMAFASGLGIIGVLLAAICTGNMLYPIAYLQDITEDVSYSQEEIELWTVESEIMSYEQPYELEMHASSLLNVDKLDVYCEGKGKVGTLYDNADYKNNRDKISGDGEFSGVLLIDGYTEDTALKFYVEIDGNKSCVSNKVDFSIITPFTEKELSDMDTVDNEIRRLLEEANSKIPEGATKEEKNKIRYDMVYPYLEKIADINNPDRLIKDLQYFDETIRFTYLSSGIDNTLALWVHWEDGDDALKCN